MSDKLDIKNPTKPTKLEWVATTVPVSVQGADGMRLRFDYFDAHKGSGWVLEHHADKRVVRIYSLARSKKPDGAEVTTVPESWCGWHAKDDCEAT